jgi:hypothetical protein
MSERLGECDACGDDLFDGVPHDCLVTGSIVLAATNES